MTEANDINGQTTEHRETPDDLNVHKSKQKPGFLGALRAGYRSALNFVATPKSNNNDEQRMSRRGFLQLGGRAAATVAGLALVSKVTPGCGAVDAIIDPIVDGVQFVVDKGSEALSAVGQLGLEMATPGAPLDAATIIRWYKNPTTDEARLVSKVYAEEVIPKLDALLQNKSYKQSTPEIKELLQEYLILAVLTKHIAVLYKTKVSEMNQLELEVDNEKRKVGTNINLDKLNSQIDTYDARIEKLQEHINKAKTPVERESFQEDMEKLRENRDNLVDQKDTAMEPYRKAVSDETTYKLENLYFSKVQIHDLLRQLEQGLGVVKNAYEKEANTVKRAQ